MGNPADVLLELCDETKLAEHRAHSRSDSKHRHSDRDSNTSDTSDNAPVDLDVVTIYERSELHHHNIALSEQGVAQDDFSLPNFKDGSQKRISIYHELTLLTKRFLREFWRQRTELQVRFFLALAMGVVVGLLFLNNSQDQSGPSRRLSLLFCAITIAAFSNLFNIPALVRLRGFYNREVASKTYRGVSFFISRCVAESPLFFVQSVLFCFSYYYLGRMREDADHLFTFFLGY